MRRALVLSVLLVLPAMAACLSEPAPPGQSQEPQPGGELQPAVVAAAHEHAAQAGADVLEQGGNAVDAAAAVQFALNVVEPHFSGIGGGLFMLVYKAEADEIVMVDGRETAPADLPSDVYEDNDDEHPDRMGYSVGVPGTLAAFDHAIERYGTMELGSILEPAVELAREGFEVYPSLSEFIALNREELASWPASAGKYLLGAVCVDNETGCTGGAPLPPGYVLAQPDLADTFELLAREGPEAFYEGEIGEAIVDTVAQRAGPMAMDDLAGYEPVEREPLTVAYENRTVVSGAPPSGGTIVLQSLGMLDGQLAAEGFETTTSVHRTLEALKLAYADRRAHVADPAFVDVPAEGMLHPDYLDARAERIGPEANMDPQPGDPWAYQEGNGSGEGQRSEEGEHTTHFVVVDHEGNVASVTTTIESSFGNGQTVPGYGFLLNDELTDFTWETGQVNSPAGDKRPRSSMSPTVVLEEGQPVMAVGSPGGLTIPASVAEVVRNVYAHEASLEEAVEASRQYPGEPPRVSYDRELPAETMQGLSDRGHRLAPNPIGQGNVHAIERAPGETWEGWADTRRGEGGVVTVPAEAS